MCCLLSCRPTAKWEKHKTLSEHKVWKNVKDLTNHAVIASDTRRDIGLVDYAAQPLTNSSNAVCKWTERLRALEYMEIIKMHAIVRPGAIKCWPCRVSVCVCCGAALVYTRNWTAWVSLLNSATLWSESSESHVNSTTFYIQTSVYA